MAEQFTATGYKDGSIQSWKIFTVNKDHADMISSSIHATLSQCDAVMIQLPKDITIKLTDKGSKVVARVLDFTSDQQITSTITADIGEPCPITHTPLAWKNGEIFIAQLISENMRKGQASLERIKIEDLKPVSLPY